MVKFNLKHSSLLLGAAVIALTAGAEETWRDVTNQYVKNSAFIPGWQGALAATDHGVAEVWCGAFNLYQVIHDLPAGNYTLTANAFYRCGNNDFAKANQTGNDNLNTTVIYAGKESEIVKGLFDGRETAPNNLEEANAAFSNGEYLNTLPFTHEGGDLVFGIRNTGCYNDEWAAFDNFKLVGPNGEVTIPNGDFSEGLNAKAEGWDMNNSEGKVKTPDMNKRGGVYRKTNASPYNFGQQIELPAGKYRFSALTFLRHGGAGNYDGKIISVKGQWGFNDVEMSPKQWYDKNYYDNDDFTSNAYLYVSYEEDKPTSLETCISQLEEHIVYTSLKDCWQICEGKYDEMPENETRGTAEGTEIVPAYEVKNVVAGWDDSGIERESAAAFVNEPEKWRQYVEFELTEPGMVWVGLAKDANAPAQYWNPFADFKLEVSTGGAGVEGIETEAVAGEVEYYNLQGVRVANPENGMFVRRQGNKTTKVVL